MKPCPKSEQAYITATVLRDRGYEVLEANSGEEALGMLEKQGLEDIKLLLTEVGMPQMAGQHQTDYRNDLG